MTAAILAQAGECLATRGNLNNHIGVPLTLLRLTAAHRFAVIEMGANHAGEVAALVAHRQRPTIGMITNAGAEHLEGFGSLEGVARAEGEMVAGLRADATAVINADDEFAHLWREAPPRRAWSPSACARAADFRASELRVRRGRRRLPHPLPPGCPGRAAPHRAAAGGRAQRRQRACRRGRRRQRRRDA